VQAPQLRYWREKRFLTQEQLAAQAGVASATISRIEQGHDARITTLVRLARALGVEPRALVEEVPDAKGQESAAA
jgi:transcriptional regulator with XRE-family HTH domain